MEAYLSKLILGAFIQTAWLTGVVILVGLLLGHFRQNTMINLRLSLGDQAINITGLVGTPVHEMSHLLLAVLFGHSIIGYKLYQPLETDGSMGWVSHSYDQYNPYHRIGNFYIGIAPIIGGTMVIMSLMYFCIPDSFRAYIALLSDGILIESPNEVIIFNHFFEYIHLFKDLLTYENFINPLFTLFFVLSICVSMHMSLSQEDIKEAAGGLIFIFLMIMLFNVFEMRFKFLPINQIQYNIILTGFLGISFLFSVSAYIISWVLRIACPRR